MERTCAAAWAREEVSLVTLKYSYFMYLDLRHAARCGWDAREIKLAEAVVVARHSPLTLIDLDVDSRLVVLVRREDLRLLRGNGGAARHELGHHAADGLNAEGEGGHIEEEEVLGLVTALAREDAALDGRAVGDGLVGVDALVRLLACAVGNRGERGKTR